MSVNDKSELLSETYDYVNNIYTKNYGNLESEFFYPTDFEQSKKWFNDFLENRFKEFGPYEDAIIDSESF